MAGLIDRGFDVIRAVDAAPEGTDDIDHFERAVRLGRILIANDKHMKAIAERWIAEGHSFPGLIWWPRKNYAIMSNAPPPGTKRPRSAGYLPVTARTGARMRVLMATAAKTVYAHIIKDPKVCGGSACLDSTRIRVIDVVQAQSEGYTPVQIQGLFAVKLTLAQVYSALAYADENHEEIKAEYAEHERTFNAGARARDEYLKNRPRT